MATWAEIGAENYGAARDLLDGGHYRSSVSRFYYAAFSVLTYELSRKRVVFANGRETPSHASLPELLRLHLTQFSEQKRGNIVLLTVRLYRARLAADYGAARIDRRTALSALRLADKIFGYFGLEARQ